MIALPQNWLTRAIFGFLAFSASTLRAELTEIPVEISASVGTDASDLMLLQFIVEPRWDFLIGEHGSTVISARLRLDGEDKLEPDEPAFDNYSSISKPIHLGDAGTLELRDIYYEHLLDQGLFRIGKQQIVWGRLDGIKILDVVNPQTYREFILDDLEHSRIGLWSAYFDLSFKTWRAELTWIPDLTNHDIPKPGAWFELTAPRFRFGSPPQSPGLPSLTNSDKNWLDDGALAARLSKPMGDIDVSFLIYSGLDHEPLGRLVGDVNNPMVEQFYRRRNVLGLSAESSFGPIAWRAELSHQPGRHFNIQNGSGLDTLALNQITLGLGADIELPLNVFASVQLVWDQVDDAPTSLIRPDEDQLMTLFFRRGFSYDTISTEFRWFHSLTAHDDSVVATLRYELNDNTSTYLSSEWFQGTADGLFGQFAEQDRVYLGLTHYF